MDTGRQINKPGPANPAGDVSDAVGQSSNKCKIIPFRQRRVRESFSTCKPATDCVVDEAGGEKSFEERRDFPVACQPVHSETSCGHSDMRWKEEPTGSASLPTPRWFKKLLFMSTFTAGAAVAIALTIALG
jgi:hypothetical protein